MKKKQHNKNGELESHQFLGTRYDERQWRALRERCVATLQSFTVRRIGGRCLPGLSRGDFGKLMLELPLSVKPQTNDELYRLLDKEEWIWVLGMGWHDSLDERFVWAGQPDHFREVWEGNFPSASL
jgi:hypothetical protein